MDVVRTRPILVFQMAKVASRSWMQLLQQTFPERDVVHFHSITEKSAEYIGEIERLTGPAQTIKYPSLPRLGRPPERIARFIRNGRWIGPNVDILAGVREPVARAISAVAFLSNRMGHTRHAVTVRDGGSPETLRSLFFEVLRMARGPQPEQWEDTFVQMLGRVLHAYRNWFAEEMEPGFGIDVTKAEFDRDARAMVVDGPCRLFVYRVEDLLDPEAHARVVDAASRFFGRELGAVPPQNTAGEARFRELYRPFAQSISLTADELDWFYDCQTVGTFYTPEEVAAFRRRWQR